LKTESSGESGGYGRAGRGETTRTAIRHRTQKLVENKRWVTEKEKRNPAYKIEKGERNQEGAIEIKQNAREKRKRGVHQLSELRKKNGER